MPMGRSQCASGLESFRLHAVFVGSVQLTRIRLDTILSAEKCLPVPMTCYCCYVLSENIPLGGLYP